MLDGLEDPMRAARLDISIRSSGPVRWTFTFECKRLGEAHQLEITSIAGHGLRSCRYAASEPQRRHARYIVSGTAAAWLNRVNEVIDKHSDLGPSHQLSYTSGALTTTSYESQHTRSTCRDISTYPHWSDLRDDLRTVPLHRTDSSRPHQRRNRRAAIDG